MNIGSLTQTANSLAEESFNSSQVVEFVNDAIAKINIETGANFPFMSANDPSEYTAFPEKWQRALFIPFVVGRMKAVDASQFEYQDQYTEFSANLNQFQLKFSIPEEFKDLNEPKSFSPDFTGNYFTWG